MARSAIARLGLDVSSGRVTKVRILFAHYELMTRTALNPKLLEGAASFDRVFEVGKDRKETLLRAIAKTELTSLDSDPDLRWGAIFLDQEGAVVHSLYLNGTSLLGAGRQGLIDGTRARFNSSLYDWFEESFGAEVRLSKPR